jgi:branched-chain amino acid transport system permease protein
MLDLLLNGLAIGSMYAMGTVALSMIWGSLGILNMAHGAILTIGAYASYVVAAQLGLPWWAGAGAAALAGVACGTLLYHSVVRWLFDKPNAPINVIIATIAVGALAENVITVGLSAEPRLQPFSFDGSFQIAGVAIRTQPFVVLAAAMAMTLVVSLLLNRSRLGRTIRAVSQQRTAAALMGVRVKSVFLQIMIIAGVMSALSGLLLTGMTTIYPTVGAQPMTKALIICTVAGLGSLWQTTAVALLFGLGEVIVQNYLGARFGFPVMLSLAILILIVRPSGLFGRSMRVSV